MKPPHRKGDSMAASRPSIAGATEVWATEPCYRNKVLQAVRFVCHQRLPKHQHFSATEVFAALDDRGLPKYAVTVEWALSTAVSLDWCKKEQKLWSVRYHPKKEYSKNNRK